MRTLTFRITCRFTALVCATTAAVLTIGGFLLERQNRKGIEMLHQVEFDELATLLADQDETNAAEIAARIKHEADSDIALFVIQVANQRGDILFRSDNLGDTLLPIATGPERHWTSSLANLGDVRISAYSRGALRFYIGTLLQPSQRMMRDYVEMCIPLLLGTTLVSIAVGYVFSRRTLRPLRAIEATANRISADHLAERIPLPSGRDELTALTELLNRMFDRLQRSFDQVNRFAADASHEMKTPLSLIRLHVERLAAQLPRDAEATSAIGDIMEEIATLHRVIDRLLLLAKAESGALSPAMRTLDMHAFIRTFEEDARVLAENKCVRFSVGRNDTGVVNADEEMIRQLLLNLTANAVAVSTAGQTVRLDSCDRGDSWELRMTDEGPGIPDDDLKRLFTRFYRAAPGERRAGTGLGLAFCRSIAELHKGRISAENRSDRSGLCVLVTLGK